ncbi:MAG TPA: rhomboid family intramembrane serine protease [Solirubrobacterales bacterium]|nr:rhomboid family intramembrane serine protease [Solirubrobacterales bacterium]
MAQTCYRHPNRETGVSCSSCGRPICPDCMTPTPVGMRCPECARQRTRVTRGVGEASLLHAAPATFVLIALNVAAFLAEIAGGGGGLGSSGSSVIDNFGLRGDSVANGEWYRLVTGGFLHAGLLHIGFNMFALFILGRLLEPAIGTPRFVALYFASLFAGSFGAILLTDPAQVTVGASGAIFGIFGAAFVIARGRGLSAIASQLGFVLLINLAFTFGVRGISVGGHLGGLAAGLLCGFVVIAGERGRLGRNALAAELAAMVAVAVVSIVAALAIA